MPEIRWSGQFRRDMKTAAKRRKDVRKFQAVHEILASGKPLPLKNKDHLLTGNWKGCRECHIEPDWLLVYRFFKEEDVLEYVRMGSHADLFG